MERENSTGMVASLLQQVMVLEELKKRKRSQFKTLTGREVEVLTLIAEGMKNATIAEELGISRVTVQNHRSQIRQKLDIATQAGYIKYAFAYGLIKF